MAHYARLSDLRRWMLYKGFERVRDGQNGEPETWHFTSDSGEHLWAVCYADGPDPSWIIYHGDEKGHRDRYGNKPEFQGDESTLGYLMPTMDAKYNTEPKFQRWVKSQRRKK